MKTDAEGAPVHPVRLDFNDAAPYLDQDGPPRVAPTFQPYDPTQSDDTSNDDVQTIKAALLADLENVLGHLYPRGFVEVPGHQRFRIGDVYGAEGQSVSVELKGDRAGCWYDFATGEGGDILDLWGKARGIGGFREILDDAGRRSGRTPPRIKPIERRSVRGMTGLDRPNATYKYRSPEGALLAVVYRYESDDGRKTFMPWDVEAHRYGMPRVRPLYGADALGETQDVILVEGEKCVDRLREVGVLAVSAMGGCKAPIDATDWCALKGRDVLIWPDADAAGLTYAKTLEPALREICASVRVLDVSSRSDGWDAADAIAEGLNILQLLGRAEAPAAEFELWDDIVPAPAGRYLIKGVLEREALSVVYGGSNSGKTFFALDLAYHVAAGIPWRGQRVKQGGVLYLAAEGGRSVVNRIVALKNEHGLCDLPFAIRRAGLDLFDAKADVNRIIRLAFEVNEITQSLAPDSAGLSMIVVDTLSRAIAGGDENSAKDMPAFVRNVDAIRESTGAHVMLIHHMGKDAARGARGHSSLRAAVDTEISISVETSEGDGLDFNAADRRVVKVTKQRDLCGGEEWKFDLKTVPIAVDEDGDPVTSAVVEPVEEVDQDVLMGSEKCRMKPRTARVWTVLKELFFDPTVAYATEREGLSDPVRTINRKNITSHRKWDAFRPERPDSGDYSDTEEKDSKAVLRRALSELKAFGLIGVSRDEVWMLNTSEDGDV